jgi:hypothetical protein
MKCLGYKQAIGRSIDQSLAKGLDATVIMPQPDERIPDQGETSIQIISAATAHRWAQYYIPRDYHIHAQVGQATPTGSDQRSEEGKLPILAHASRIPLGVRNLFLLRFRMHVSFSSTPVPLYR